MKRFFSVILMCILLSTVYTTAFAHESSLSAENVIHFDDGSYIIVEVHSIDSGSTSTKTGSKQYTYYNSNNVVQWRAVLSGTFTYTGSTSTCTASSCTVTISNDNWYVVSKDTGKTGATVTADVTMGYKFLGITTTKKSVNITLTCDANGNLS